MKAELNLGKKQIARNLNNYRMARPTQEFWTEWRENKMQLKDEGVSVFKRGAEFFVAIYDGTKSTEEEYNQQEAENFAAKKEMLISELYGMEDEANERDFAEAIEIVEKADSVADFTLLDRRINGIDNILCEIENSVFEKLLKA